MRGRGGRGGGREREKGVGREERALYGVGGLLFDSRRLVWGGKEKR
jgi:hypothetical protein